MRIPALKEDEFVRGKCDYTENKRGEDKSLGAS